MSLRQSRYLIANLTFLLWMATPGLLRAAEASPEVSAIMANLAVMEAGRIKPLDTVARHEIKQIYGRETIKLNVSETGEVKWGAVAAFVDWQMPTRDEFWDNQPFILAEFVPLKELILTQSAQASLQSAISSSEIDGQTKSLLEGLASAESIQHDALKLVLEQGKLSENLRAELESLSKKLDVGSKWLSPKDIQESRVKIDGRLLNFEDWFRNLVAKKNGGGMMSATPVKLTELENRAYEVGGRFAHYKAIRDRSGLGRTPIYTVMPRPVSDAYLKFTADGLKMAIEGQEASLSPLQRDAVEALDRYFEDIPKSDRALPGSNPDFDRKYKVWLAERSPWIPLFTLIESDDKELASAGFDAAIASKMRDAFRKLEAESQDQGITTASATEFVKQSRDLGEKLSGYPSLASLKRESHFNSFAPFFKAPSVYGTGLFFLLFSLVFTGIGVNGNVFFAKAGKITYLIGMIAFVGGILLEIYGFYLRIMISGWAPVTNMYETVIWVALVTAVIGLALELIYRKIYAATAATGVALLATLLAANVSLLDPEIRSLQPVLRSNYWLTIHVLTIVSSYAAFALALGLGMLATAYYLTATYRRSPSFLSLMIPGIIGLPGLVFGYLAVSGAAGDFVTSETGYYASFLLAEIGLVLTGASVFGVLGELIARAIFRSYAASELKMDSLIQTKSEETVVESKSEALLSTSSTKQQATLTASGATAVMEAPVTQTTSRLIEQIRQSSTQMPPANSPREQSMRDTAA
ncbi:MAG: hypothetical protein RJA81_1080, partial [Planctomycetota bacterium]